MHTVLSRGNAIFAYSLSVLACLTFCCFLSTVFLDYHTSVEIDTVKVLVWVIPTKRFPLAPLSTRRRKTSFYVNYSFVIDAISVFRLWKIGKMYLTSVRHARKRIWVSLLSIWKPTWTDSSTGMSKSSFCIWPLNTKQKTMNWIKWCSGTKSYYVAKMHY